MHEHVIDGMRYLEAGAGWPVVLIHAFPLNADMWRPQLARVPAGWRFIAPDLIGFTPSRPSRGGALSPGNPPLPPSGESLTMDDYARGVARLLDALEIDEAIIGGLSMGGYITFALFRLAPERFSGAILADTRPQADSDDGKKNRTRMRELLAARGVEAIAEEMLPNLLSREADAALVASVRRIVETLPPSAIDAALGAMRERPDSTADLAKMSFPVLVVVGDQDEVTPPPDAERMQAQLPRSRLTVIPGAGHLANLERPHEFSQALDDFLVAAM
jgi:pimeloyl-ACP methyl ester carboxylesterase